MPFIIRTGKSLPVTATEVLVRLRPPPRAVFSDGALPEGDHIRFQLGPDVSISLGARVKTPGEAMVGEPVELVACHRRGDGRPPNERLIGDAAVGDRSLFAREDSIEAAWRVVEGVLDDRTPVHDYEPGNWGPPQADRLLAPGEHWHVPSSATPAAHSSHLTGPRPAPKKPTCCSGSQTRVDD